MPGFLWSTSASAFSSSFRKVHIRFSSSTDPAVKLFQGIFNHVAYSTSGYFPTVLILCHVFVKRLHRDLHSGFNHRAQLVFNLTNSAVVHLHGFGGRTVSQLKEEDLFVISRHVPTLVILEMGTNDIFSARPEVNRSTIADLVVFIHDHFQVSVIRVCEVIPRRLPVPSSDFPNTKFNREAAL